jgi:hypothetical protein
MFSSATFPGGKHRNFPFHHIKSGMGSIEIPSQRLFAPRAPSNQRAGVAITALGAVFVTLTLNSCVKESLARYCWPSAQRRGLYIRNFEYRRPISSSDLTRA